MAVKLNIVGEAELTDEELFEAVNRFIQEKFGYPANSVEIRKGKVVATIKHEFGGKPFDRPHPDVWAANQQNFQEVSRKWNGLYSSIGEIVEAQRKKRKKFISFEDLRSELLTMEDLARNKMFIKNGEEIPMSVIKQRLAPSQLIRQAKRQANLKGVVYDRAGLKL